MMQALYKLPEGWRWIRLGEVFDLQQGASMSPKRRMGYNPKPFLRTKNVLGGEIDLSAVDQMDFSEEEYILDESCISSCLSRCTEQNGFSHPSRTRLKQLKAPLPPLEEQRRIVAHLEAVQVKVNVVKEAQVRTDKDLRRLEQAILERAFRGEL